MTVARRSVTITVPLNYAVSDAEAANIGKVSVA